MGQNASEGFNLGEMLSYVVNGREICVILLKVE